MHNIRLGEPKLGDTVLINGHEFVILKEVGKGSSGRVFQALSNRYHEIFALKWIEIKRDDDRQSIQNEIQLMRKLGRLENVDTVVLLFDFMSTPDAIYLVMELGEIDLASLLKRQHKKKFNMSNIRSWWHQILLAVKTIHDEEIVHTDLKPANFVMVKGTLKLIDFGIAKKIEDDTLHIHRDNQVGTINYMSPEALIEVNESFSQRILIKQGKPSDVWSLGCILYHMVYGRPPFYHLTPPQKVLKIPDHAHPIPFPFEATDGTGAKVTLSKDLIILMKHCLNRDAAARPSVGELLNHPFCQ
ncbi:kinase-like domain-containing protein [Mycotypha africana]|uniref:kinase-like domain-containing protein n=1 Tax=Mycotypha africana TaxID=64632 RepID=UPI0023009736|nr:kinase-like domain-containing protein [Mycotypha africana]KAI8973690.1 kinase-like domain-containing protein [Mycotypha africana]